MVTAQARERWRMNLPRDVRRSVDPRKGCELLFVPIDRGEGLVRTSPPRAPIAAFLARFADDGPAPILDELRAASGGDLAVASTPTVAGTGATNAAS